MGLKLTESKPLVMFPVFYQPNHRGAFLWSSLKEARESYLKWCAVLVAYRLINLLWHEWLQKGGKECNIGPFGVFCTFMKSFITISICLVMTDNCYYEKSSGHQSDRSGWVLLPKEVSVSQDCCWSEQLPRAVLGGRVMSWWIRLQCFFLGI